MGQVQFENLTAAEHEVLRLVELGHLWPAAIARRRKCTRQAVQKVLRSLEKKGWVHRPAGSKVYMTCTPRGHVTHHDSVTTPHSAVSANAHPIRLHGEEWRIGILYSSPSYGRARLVRDSILLDGNRLVLYRDSIVVFSYQSFEGADPDDCERAASPYWLKFFRQIEQHYGLVILKNRSENIKRVKAHYADVHNELAQELRKRKEKLRVFGTTDGKEWLLFDDSFNLDEAETTHSATARDDRSAKEDMATVVQPLFNDYREMARAGNLVLPSQQAALQAEQTAALGRILAILEVQAGHGRETAASLQAVAKVLESQLQAQNPGLPQPEPWPKGEKPDYFG